MSHEMDRQRGGLACTPMWEADVRCQHTVRKSRQRLLGVVGVDCRQTTKMSGVECLEKVECLRTAHLADEDAVGTMSQCRSYQISDRHRRHRLLLAERRLR